MNYYDKVRNLKIDRPTVVAIGKFVGVHKGHQKLIGEINRAKKRLGGGAESLIFFLTGITEALYTIDEKKEKFKSLGVDNVVECEFTDEIRKMSAEVFLDRIILGRLGAKVIVAGPDVKFGFMGKGDAEFLRTHAAEKGYEVIIIDKEKFKGEDISSTRIKQCIKDGNLEDAKAMLG